MEKPVLGRGLDSLIAGGSDRRASDMLSSFQAKRTRVAPGLRSLLQGNQNVPRKPVAPRPTAPTPAPVQPLPPPPDAGMGRLRVSRPPRSKPMPGAGRYRPTRALRSAAPAAAAPEEKKNRDLTATGPVHSSAEPAFQRPVVRKPPAYLKSQPQPAPKPPRQSVVSPGFRLALFVVDWFLLFAGFAVVWYATPPVGWFTVTLCSLAVVVGAALGTWSLMLEPSTTEEADEAG